MTTPQTTPESATAPYERLTAWQACHTVALAVHQVSARWPREELIGLTAEARRASAEASTSIVQGQSSHAPAEFQASLNTALGALSRLRYLLHLSRDLGLTPAEQWGELEALRDHAARLTRGLQEAVGKRGKKGRNRTANARSNDDASSEA